MASRKIYSPPILVEIEERMVVRIRNMAVCYGLREKEARPSGLFFFNGCNDILVRDINKDDGLDTLLRKIKSLYA